MRQGPAGKARLIAFVVGTTVLAGGCAGADVRGHYFNLQAKGAQDDCTGASVNYAEKVGYRLVLDGNDLEVAVDEDVFASGMLNGCSIQYESVIWADERDGFELRWQIHGAATVNIGGAESCKPQNGTDWDGTEIFEVISSQDPAISPGCEYTLNMSGKYVEEVK